MYCSPLHMANKPVPTQSIVYLFLSLVIPAESFNYREIHNYYIYIFNYLFYFIKFFFKKKKKKKKK